jgi:hypothetical protein
MAFAVGGIGLNGIGDSVVFRRTKGRGLFEEFLVVHVVGKDL